MLLKRIANNLGPVLAMACGILVGATMLCSIPLFSEAINRSLLEEKLGKLIGPSGRGLPVLVISSKTEINDHTRATYQKMRTFLREDAPHLLALSPQAMVERGEVGPLPLVSAPKATGEVKAEEPEYVRLNYLEDFAQHIDIIEGSYPSPVGSGEVVEVLISEASLLEPEGLGLRVGEEAIVTNDSRYNPAALRLRVVGIWKPQDRKDSYWFVPPQAYDGDFILSKEAFFQQVMPHFPSPDYRWRWFVGFEVQDITTQSVPRVLGGVYMLRREVEKTWPGSVSFYVRDVERILSSFVSASFFLRTLLFILSIPILVMVLYFIVLCASMAIQRERTEIATLKSRGMSTGQLMGMYLLEILLICGLVLMASPFLGAGVAHLIGRTSGFLSFAAKRSLHVQLSAQALRFGLLAIFPSVLATILPGLQAARHSIVTLKRQMGRVLHRPWWQRLPYDFLLLALCIYGYWSLRQQGHLLGVGSSGAYYIDPFLVLLPAVLIFSLGLIFLRLFPHMAAALAAVLSGLGGISLSLSLKRIARVPGYHRGLLILVIVTVALGLFNASLTQSLEDNFSEQIYYRYGADLNLLVWGDENEAFGRWIFPPKSLYSTLPGVRAATVIAPIEVKLEQGERAQLLAIDPSDFSQAAWYRDGLMRIPRDDVVKALRRDIAGIFVNRSYGEEHGIGPGDIIKLPLANGRTMPFIVEGFLDYFPTLYPQEGPFFVANIHYLDHDLGHAQQVWLRTSSKVDIQSLESVLAEKRIRVGDISDAFSEIEKLRENPQRLGLLGILSFGFIASTLLMALGFSIYFYLSLESRRAELGILRAIGLSRWELTSQVVFELLFLMLLGVGTATFLGVLTTRLFVPFLQIGTDKYAQTPPFRIIIAWGGILKMYLILGISTVLILASNIWLLLRVPIHQSIKLGEQQQQ